MTAFLINRSINLSINQSTNLSNNLWIDRNTSRHVPTHWKTTIHLNQRRNFAQDASQLHVWPAEISHPWTAAGVERPNVVHPLKFAGTARRRLNSRTTTEEIPVDSLRDPGWLRQILWRSRATVPLRSGRKSPARPAGGGISCSRWQTFYRAARRFPAVGADRIRLIQRIERVAYGWKLHRTRIQQRKRSQESTKKSRRRNDQ